MTKKIRAASELRRQQIIEAALRLACGRSPEGISTQAIADETGISQGGLFRHFPNRDAIWAAAIAWVRENFIACIDAAAATENEPLRKLEAMFLAHAQFVSEHPAMPRMIFHELQRPIESPLRAEVRAVLQGYRSRIEKQLHAASDQGELSASLNMPSAITLFVGMIQGLVMQSAIADKQLNLQKPAQQLFVLFLRAIEARNPT